MAISTVSFGEWLKGALTERGWSYDRAARELGVAKTTVQRWVKGQREPRFSELRKIWVALGPLPPDLMRMLRQHGTAVA
jgi:ribosome-binding protein aMBF1 (putative translation factor)